MHRHDTIQSVEMGKATETLIQQAKNTVSTRYNGVLAFHDLDHTQQVIDASYFMAGQLLRSGYITIEEYIALPYSAATHDMVHDSPDAEIESAQEATKLMKDSYFDYSEHIISAVGNAILGTITTLDPTTTRLHQKAAEYKGPHSKFCKALADCDLVSFVSPTSVFLQNSSNYFTETHGHTLTEADRSTQIDFWLQQETLVRTHEYLLPNILESGPKYKYRKNNVQAATNKVTELRAA